MDTKLKTKYFTFNTYDGTAFEKFHQAFSNRKIVILIAKGNSSSYNRFSQVSKEKVLLSL